MSRNDKDDSRTESQLQMSRFVGALTCGLLRLVLRYEPDTGKLYWRRRPVWLFRETRRSAASVCVGWNSRWAGAAAFTAQKDGYLAGRIFDRMYRAHRVMWVLQTGVWPEDEIDHINHDRSDNRWCNLRAVTKSQNQRNASISSNNTSGVLGVSRCSPGSQRRGWRARIYVDGDHIELGRFTRKEDAAAARKAADIKHGFHANHGVPADV